jgi:hypothetical protein
VDGIVFDEFGNPKEYHVLKNHPGGSSGAVGQDCGKVPAESMIHWFRADRPGQSRGLPDILPALPLLAQLRRYTLAVIAAARVPPEGAGKPHRTSDNSHGEVRVGFDRVLERPSQFRRLLGNNLARIPSV